jgi:hypothetical protein
MLDCDKPFFEQFPHELAPGWVASFLVLVSNELASTDGLIESMVRAELGPTAIAAYLGCARAQILEAAARRGIGFDPEQVEKPLRARKNAWSSQDHLLFITGWTCSVHVPALANLLGRSPASLYAKRRRIGLPPRTTHKQASAEPRNSTRRYRAPESSSITSIYVPLPANPSPPPRSTPVFVRGPRTRKRASRKFEPSTLSPARHPELHAAVEEFLTNRMPAGVDLVRNYATADYVITGVALLGGMSRAAIAEAAGFTASRVNSHIERLHLSSKGARTETFDARRYAAAIEVSVPACDYEAKRLIFRAAGDHRLCLVRKRDARRRELAEQRRLEQREAQRREQEERMRAANIVVRNGVSLRRLLFLERPLEIAA